MWRLLEIGETIDCEIDLTFLFLPDGCNWGPVDPEMDGMVVEKGKWPILRKISDEGELQKPADNIKSIQCHMCGEPLDSAAGSVGFHARCYYDD